MFFAEKSELNPDTRRRPLSLQSSMDAKSYLNVSPPCELCGGIFGNPPHNWYEDCVNDKRRALSGGNVRARSKSATTDYHPSRYQKKNRRAPKRNPISYAEPGEAGIGFISEIFDAEVALRPAGLHLSSVERR
jgi:hypothetical protein